MKRERNILVSLGSSCLLIYTRVLFAMRAITYRLLEAVDARAAVSLFPNLRALLSFFLPRTRLFVVVTAVCCKLDWG